MWSHDSEQRRHRDRGIDGVATPFDHVHAGGGREYVVRRHRGIDSADIGTHRRQLSDPGRREKRK
jgi:hypothetical protein